MSTENGIWEYGDAEFLSFEERLRHHGLMTSRIWPLRDLVYYALTYSNANDTMPRRWRSGYIGWFLWLLREVLQSGGRTPVNISLLHLNSSHFLFLSHHTSHYNTLFPILKRECEKLPCIAWISGLSPQQLEEVAALPGTTAIEVSWHQVGKLSMLVAAFHAVASARQFLRIIRSVSETPVKQTVRVRLLEALFELYCWKRLWNELPVVDKKTHWFVTNESTAMAKSFAMECRRRNGHLTHYCHGMAHAPHAVTLADRMVAFGQADGQWLQSRVPDTCTVDFLGNPRISQIRDRVGPPRSRKNGQPLRLLFFGQGPETPYSENLLVKDLSILKLPDDLANHVLLRIRPHPRETAENTERWAHMAGVRIESLSRNTLEDDLRWADVCATAWSTALLEGLACGRICFWISAGNNRFARSGEYIDRGLGMLVSTNMDWIEEIRKHTGTLYSSSEASR